MDDAIIDIENVVRRLREHRTRVAAGHGRRRPARLGRGARRDRLRDADRDVAIVPVLLPRRAVRRVLPALGAVLRAGAAGLDDRGADRHPGAGADRPATSSFKRRAAPVARLLQAGYTGSSSRIINSAKPAYRRRRGSGVAGLAVIPGLGQSLLPEFKERDFLMHFLTKPGTSLPEEVRITTASAKELQAIPGVRNFGAHIGQAFQSDEPVGAGIRGELDQHRPEGRLRDDVQAVSRRHRRVSRLIRDTQTYLKERVREVLAGTSYPIVVRIYGTDGAVLRAKAQEIYEALKHVPGTTGLKPEPQTEVPQIQIRVDLAKAQQYGLKPGDVRRAASTQIQGEEVGDIFRDGKAYDVNVWTTAAQRSGGWATSRTCASTPRGAGRYDSARSPRSSSSRP